MARTSWSRYGIQPTGDPKTRSFTVTSSRGVTIGAQHYQRGATIPRRQGENLRLQLDRSEWHSWDEAQRARAGQGGFHDYPGWVIRTSRERDRTQAEVRRDPAFNRAYLQWVRRGRPRTENPNGLLARMLGQAGIRPQSAAYPIGQSPGYKGRSHRRAA
jgi:hypothetical protein